MSARAAWRGLIPLTIRGRLVLLVIAVFVPVIAAGIWGVFLQYERERAAVEQSVRETARALALVVDREIGKREIVARLLSDSPYLDAGEFRLFYQQAQQATRGMRGWVVLADPERQIVNTALPFDAQIPSRPPGQTRRFAFATDRVVVTDLALGRITNVPAAAVQVPVNRAGRTVFNVAVTIRPDELQQILQEQRPPAGWVVAVLDRSNTVIARLPSPQPWVARPANADLTKAIAQQSEGFIESVTLEGVPVVAFYSRSPTYGWSFVIAVPQSLLGRSIERSLIDLVTMALGLFALSVALAVWLGRRIARPIYRLQEAAAQLERNEPVVREATGVAECDHVNTALADASKRILAANAELERRVADAVATTEQVQAQLAGTQRLEALGRLTGGVAHDFNNLLAVINNNLFMLQRRAAAGVPANELAAIQRAVNTGVRLTRQLLAFSRRQPLQPQRLQLQHQLLAIAELIESSLGKDIALAVEIAPDVAPIEVDAAELELALINLAMNAKDAMPEGGRLTIRARNADADALPGRTAAMVAIEVVDTGTGIAADLLDRVFDPFFTTKSAGQGTGLGLSQVYGFCAQAGGTARIASVQGTGTTVTMLLPPAPDAVEGIAHPAARNAPAEPVRVLLVDDNVDLVLATAPMLETFGFAVTTAFSADEALRILDRGGVDVVLSDVSMPGERNGLDLARHVRGERPSIPVVLMTGYTAELQRAVAEGFKVLQKPCTPERVAATLQEASAPALRD